jgi:hypothetical protein
MPTKSRGLRRGINELAIGSARAHSEPMIQVPGLKERNVQSRERYGLD